MNTHWHERWDTDGALWLGLDYAGGPVNLLSSAVIDELDAYLTQLEGRPPRTLILHSCKDRGFIAGADVKEFVGQTDPAALKARITEVHAILGRLEALPCPTLALIHGFCLGGGLELALCCRYRIASDDAHTRIGFPEVKLGIFPAYGGTWRAIRTLGPLPALELIMTGRALSAHQAHKMGLVDRVVPRRHLETAALALLRSPPPPRRLGITQRLVGIQPMRTAMAALLRRRTRERVNEAHYPAPFAIIEHWRENASKGPALLASEAERVARLLTGERAQNLIRVFHLQERLKGFGRGDAPVPQRVQVVGAGAMGGDIAAWAALSGRRVSLQDLSQPQLARAMKRAGALFEKRLRKPRLIRDAWDRLMPDPHGDGLRRTDLVIEAIVEDTDANFSTVVNRAVHRAGRSINRLLRRERERRVHPGRLRTAAGQEW